MFIKSSYDVHFIDDVNVKIAMLFDHQTDITLRRPLMSWLKPNLYIHTIAFRRIHKCVCQR
jgi:hypothetical protein